MDRVPRCPSASTALSPDGAVRSHSVPPAALHRFTNPPGILQRSHPTPEARIHASSIRLEHARSDRMLTPLQAAAHAAPSTGPQRQVLTNRSIHAPGWFLSPSISTACCTAVPHCYSSLLFQNPPKPPAPARPCFVMHPPSLHHTPAIIPDTRYHHSLCQMYPRSLPVCVMCHGVSPLPRDACVPQGRHHSSAWASFAGTAARCCFASPAYPDVLSTAVP